MIEEAYSNIYFSLDLQIPKKFVQRQKTHVEPNHDLPKFGLVEILENIFERDLRKNNPWLNGNVASEKLQKSLFCSY
jgi:hypothetical protein